MSTLALAGDPPASGHDHRTAAPAPRFAVLQPAPVLLPSFTDARRLASRPVEHRPPGFDDQFDAETLFYDAFPRPDGRLVLLGPAFLNLEPAIRSMTVRARPSGAICRFEVRAWNRHGQVLVEAPAGTVGLDLDLSFGTVSVPLSPSELDVFAGRRVIFTLSRNNRLAWIQDWLRFARDIHGAEAVLLYDNGSTAYAPQALLEAVAQVEGIAIGRVVTWPFRYGPQGLDAWRFWDSDFCQHGVLEHARRRFLAAAAAAQNADIDEMVISRSGQSVFEAAARDPFGTLRYGGRWVTVAAEHQRDDREPTHRDHTLVLRRRPARRFGILPADAHACPPKWTVVPSRIPDHVQWSVHALGRWLPGRRLSRRFGYRHFMSITDNWKYKRSTSSAADPSRRYDPDEELAGHLARVDWNR